MDIEEFITLNVHYQTCQLKKVNVRHLAFILFTWYVFQLFSGAIWFWATCCKIMPWNGGQRHFVPLSSSQLSGASSTDWSGYSTTKNIVLCDKTAGDPILQHCGFCSTQWRSISVAEKFATLLYLHFLSINFELLDFNTKALLVLELSCLADSSFPHTNILWEHGNHGFHWPAFCVLV